MASYFEVYNEEVVDLLSDNKGRHTQGKGPATAKLLKPIVREDGIHAIHHAVAFWCSFESSCNADQTLSKASFPGFVWCRSFLELACCETCSTVDCWWMQVTCTSSSD